MPTTASTAVHPRRTVRVQLGERSYDVLIGPGLLDELGALVRSALRRPTARAFIAADHRLSIGAVDHAAASLYASGFTVSSTRLHADEARKSLASLETLLAEIARTRHERWDPIIALGGGVVGDVAGFAAAVYRRGVPVVQCPTTLLAMVDASVGGKTGVNLDISPHAPGSQLSDPGALKKNFLGAFHQPALVIADVATLATLPDRVFRAGLAECVKHGLIGAHANDPMLLDWIKAHSARILNKDADAVTELVARNVAVKASIVAGDEREVADDADGGRALLNLGHTFAHAIETLRHVSPTGSPADAPLQHGEAVAVGLVAAAHCSAAMGLAPRSFADGVRAVVASLGLPTAVAALPSNPDLRAHMLHDKKTVGGRVRLVLPLPGGRARVTAEAPTSAVDAGWDAVRHPNG